MDVAEHRQEMKNLGLDPTILNDQQILFPNLNLGVQDTLPGDRRLFLTWRTIPGAIRPNGKIRSANPATMTDFGIP